MAARCADSLSLSPRCMGPLPTVVCGHPGFALGSSPAEGAPFLRSALAFACGGAQHCPACRHSCPGPDGVLEQPCLLSGVASLVVLFDGEVALSRGVAPPPAFASTLLAFIPKSSSSPTCFFSQSCLLTRVASAAEHQVADRARALDRFGPAATLGRPPRGRRRTPEQVRTAIPTALITTTRAPPRDRQGRKPPRPQKKTPLRLEGGVSRKASTGRARTTTRADLAGGRESMIFGRRPVRRRSLPFELEHTDVSQRWRPRRAQCIASPSCATMARRPSTP